MILFLLFVLHTVGSYKNSGNVVVAPGAYVEYDSGVVKKKSSNLMGWTLGVDIDNDPPNARVNCLLFIVKPGVEDEFLGDYLYRSGRQMRGVPEKFDDPYILTSDEEVHLFLVAKNDGSSSFTARCNTVVKFRVE